MNVKDVFYNKDLPLHLTFDFNVNPYMTLLVHQVEGLKAIQIDEFCLPDPKNTTEEICKEFAKKYFHHEAGIFIYGDPSGMAQDTRTKKGQNDYTIILGILQKFRPQLRVTKKAPSVTMRIGWINQIFKGNNEVEFIVGRNCKKTIKDYNHCKEASDGTKLKNIVKDKLTGISYQEFGHSSDANDYFLTTCFLKQYTDYLRGGKKSITHSINTRKQRF